MLKILRRGQRWVTALFVVGIGGVFVFFIGLGGPLQGQSGGTVIEAGSIRFGLRDFQRVRAEREQAFRDQLGDDYDENRFRDSLDMGAAQMLIERAVLALEAENLGLTVSKAEIEKSVLASNSFRTEDGRFDPKQFEDWAQYEFGNQRNFMVDQRMRMQANKMLRVLYDTAEVSPGEARELARQRMEEVSFAFVVLEGGGSDDVADEAVAVYLSENEETVRARYDDAGDRFDAPEQVRARHILLRVAPDASPADEALVRARAEEIRAELAAGGDFAERATAASEDPVSAEKGGDLGFFQRGQMVPAFEAAAFSLEPGTLSEPVRTDFGFHVILVEEHQKAQHTPFAEAGLDLAREILAEERGRAARREQAEALSAAVAGGQSLEDAARAAELTLERPGFTTRRSDGYVEGLGASQEFLATAFVLPAGESSPRIFEVQDKLALLQVLERREPDEALIVETGEKDLAQLVDQKRRARVQGWIDARRTALLDAGELSVNLDAIR